LNLKATHCQAKQSKERKTFYYSPPDRRIWIIYKAGFPHTHNQPHWCSLDRDRTI